MSAAIGIKAQPSRFAALMRDSDSDDDESELKIKSRPNTKGVSKPNKKSEPAALKNAKKRARKRKNQLKGSQHEEPHEVRSNIVCNGVDELHVSRHGVKLESSLLSRLLYSASRDKPGGHTRTGKANRLP